MLRGEFGFVVKGSLVCSETPPTNLSCGTSQQSDTRWVAGIATLRRLLFKEEIEREPVVVRD